MRTCETCGRVRPNSQRSCECGGVTKETDAERSKSFGKAVGAIVFGLGCLFVVGYNVKSEDGLPIDLPVRAQAQIRIVAACLPTEEETRHADWTRHLPTDRYVDVGIVEYGTGYGLKVRFPKTGAECWVAKTEFH
jgi:hypothetical protein